MVLPSTEAGRIMLGSPRAGSSGSLSVTVVSSAEGLADEDLLHLTASHFPAGSQQLFLSPMILVESQPRAVMQLLQVSQ